MEIFYIALLTFLAGIVGTVTGFGISTVMVPVVLLFLPLTETLLLVGVIHWFGDLWKMYFFKHGIDWRLLFFFGIPGIIMASYGASLTLKLPEIFLSRTVGALIIFYVIFILLKPEFRIKGTPVAAIFGGAGSGFLGGLTGVGGGALRAVVLTAFNVPKSVYIFTSGLLGAVIDASRIATYYLGGTRINSSLTMGLLIFIPASFVGAFIAKRIVNKIPQDKFRVVVSVFLFVVGVKLFFLSLGNSFFEGSVKSF
ncbi:MAG: sulfite exporter TauE/SafE family protein [Patescibacteria group bacterium]